MRCAQAPAGVAVKIFVELVMGIEEGVSVEFFVIAHGGDAALCIETKKINQALGQMIGDFAQRMHLAGAGRTFQAIVVTVELRQ